MSGLVPSSTVLDGWSTVLEAAAWAGVEDGLLSLVCFCRQLGDPNLSSLQILAVLPTGAVQSALDTATRGTRAFSAVEKAQVNFDDQCSETEVWFGKFFG